MQGGTSTGKQSSGSARLIIGFIAGAVFAFLPVYYYNVGRDAGLRAGVASSGEPASREAPSASDPAPPKRFASRLTYELARLPEEPPRPPARPAPPAAAQANVAAVSPVPPVAPAAVALPAPVPTSAVVAPAPALLPRQSPAAKAAPAPPPEPAAVVPGPRIANARPIRVEPLETRDMTREIAREPRLRPEAPIESRTVIASAAPAPAKQSATPSPAKPSGPPPPSKVALAPESTARIDAGQAAAGDGNIVSARFAATRDWLASAPETTHTIQLMGVGTDAQLKTHLQTLSKTLDGSKIYIFRTVAQRKPWITLVYGAYADRKAALEALEKLPPTVYSVKPVLRTVNGIRAEMKQHGTS